MSALSRARLVRPAAAIHPSNSKIDSKFTSDIQNYALVASRWYFGEAQVKKNSLNDQNRLCFLFQSFGRGVRVTDSRLIFVAIQNHTVLSESKGPILGDERCQWRGVDDLRHAPLWHISPKHAPAGFGSPGDAQVMPKRTFRYWRLNSAENLV
jgi:hypothetical protein